MRGDYGEAATYLQGKQERERWNERKREISRKTLAVF